MREAVIVTPVRTPVGRIGGALRDVKAEDLAALVVKEVVSRSGIDPAVVGDVIFAQCYPSGEDPAIGRLAALKAGLPIEVPGMQLDRRCGSGLQAICFAAMEVQTGVSDVVIAGGVESMSNAEFYVTGIRWGPNRGQLALQDRLDRGRITVSCPDRFGVINGMIATAENVAEKWGITREAQDRYALQSHRRAVAAIEQGKFKDEIVPVTVPQRRGDPVVFARDEHPRADTSLEKLAALRPVQGKTVTAGNASGENDAAAACLVMTEEMARAFGLEPMGYLKAWAVAGVHPAYMGIGPVYATRKVLQRTGLALDDFDLLEINEAFASQILAVLQELELSWEDPRLNPNGSGISIGHPLGATGARIMATMLNEMKRRNARYALETMCIGGGQGIAAIIERK